MVPTRGMDEATLDQFSPTDSAYESTVSAFRLNSPIEVICFVKNYTLYEVRKSNSWRSLANAFVIEQNGIEIDSKLNIRLVDPARQMD